MPARVDRQRQGRGADQAQLTFAMARHVAVDLALVFHVPPLEVGSERFPREAGGTCCASSWKRPGFR